MGDGSRSELERLRLEVDLLRKMVKGGDVASIAETIRRETEARSGAERFMAALATATHSLESPEEVMATTARMLAEHLQVDRCAYAPVEDERIFVIAGDYSRGVPSIVGRWEVAAFGVACVEHMRGGRPFVVEDCELDPRLEPQDREAYRATQIRAVICVPLMRRGRFAAAMAVHQATPRRFSGEEVELVTLVVGRCWDSLERIREWRSRMSTDRALIENRARLDYAVRLSGVGFWYCPLPFSELFWDERVKEHFFLPSGAQGITLEDFYARIHPEDREPTRAAIDSAIQAHRSYDTVYRTVDPATGAVKWIRALGGASYASDGAPTHFDGVTVDVTEEKRSQERLVNALARLNEQDQRKDEFLATLAHELRNPLAPISAGLQILALDVGADQHERTRQMMERQLRHLVRMVDDLLDISRVTLGKVELKRERVDFREVLAAALESAGLQMAANEQELTLDLPDEPMGLSVDVVRMSQVIANLLSNASKYTPRGGCIRLSARCIDDVLVVEVADSGIGISREMLSRIFDVFVQAKRAIAQSRGGLGLGLTLVRGLVELHGGTVEAASPGEGMGSTFTVRLPLAQRSVS